MAERPERKIYNVKKCLQKTLFYALNCTKRLFVFIVSNKRDRFITIITRLKVYFII